MEIGSGLQGTLTGKAAWDFAGSRYPDWVIRFDELHGIPEIMCWRRRTILIERSDEPFSSTSSMVHALAHIELEHRGDEFDTKEEESADRWAARMMIGLDRLVDVARWHDWKITAAMAPDLKVDRRMLATRLRTLHMSEKGHLRRARAQMEIAA